MMQNESLWRSKVQHDSEQAVVFKGGPCASFGGGEVAAHQLSDKLAKQAEIARQRKIIGGMAALRLCHTKTESAEVLTTLYELGLTPTERAPFIGLLYEQGLSLDEIVKVVWHVAEGPCYEHAIQECEEVVGIVACIVW